MYRRRKKNSTSSVSTPEPSVADDRSHKRYRRTIYVAALVGTIALLATLVVIVIDPHHVPGWIGWMDLAVLIISLLVVRGARSRFNKHQPIEGQKELKLNP
jgi:peptidoglycan/LPS O-acetylase OafA/YrhL